MGAEKIGLDPLGGAGVAEVSAGSEDGEESDVVGVPAESEHAGEETQGITVAVVAGVGGDDGIPGDEVEMGGGDVIKDPAGFGKVGAAGVHGEEGVGGAEVLGEEGLLEGEGVGGAGGGEERGVVGAGEEEEGEGMGIGGEGRRGAEEETKEAESEEGRVPGVAGGGESAEEEVEGGGAGASVGEKERLSVGESGGGEGEREERGEDVLHLLILLLLLLLRPFPLQHCLRNRGWICLRREATEEAHRIRIRIRISIHFVRWAPVGLLLLGSCWAPPPGPSLFHPFPSQPRFLFLVTSSFRFFISPPPPSPPH